MSFRSKNHERKMYHAPQKTSHSNTPSATLSDAQTAQQLDQALLAHEQAVQDVNRIFYWLLPIIAFFLTVIIANFNFYSTLGTFIIAIVAFYAVGIWRHNVLLWVAILCAYTIGDNILSYGMLNMDKLPLHLGSLLIFLAIIHVTRPFLNKWMLNLQRKQKQKLGK
ncbi:MAG: hypothetical protein Q4D05_05050 [Acinetobacter sp.]|nr:hypothetical protein [Acinetobacter sp.]